MKQVCFFVIRKDGRIEIFHKMPLFIHLNYAVCLVHFYCNTFLPLLPIGNLYIFQKNCPFLHVF